MTTFRYPRLQQQFSPRTATSYADCTATSAGMLADADSRGKLVFDHAQVRAATNEPHPDPASPGLNWQQVDAAVFDLAHGRVDLDVHSVGSPWATVPKACEAGKWAGLSVWRGVLVDAGLAGPSDFREGHAVVAGYDQGRDVPILGDPLVPHWWDVSWALLERATRAFTQRIGQPGAYFALTRDVYDDKPDLLRYSVVFAPGSFFVYDVRNGQIRGRTVHKPFRHQTSAPCTKPATYQWPQGGARKLVQITAGAIDGSYVEPGSTNVTLRVTKP